MRKMLYSEKLFLMNLKNWNKYFGMIHDPRVCHNSNAGLNRSRDPSA
jgi:hypothetical protein